MAALSARAISRAPSRPSSAPCPRKRPTIFPPICCLKNARATKRWPRVSPCNAVCNRSPRQLSPSPTSNFPLDRASNPYGAKTIYTTYRPPTAQPTKAGIWRWPRRRPRRPFCSKILPPHWRNTCGKYPSRKSSRWAWPSPKNTSNSKTSPVPYPRMTTFSQSSRAMCFRTKNTEDLRFTLHPACSVIAPSSNALAKFYRSRPRLSNACAKKPITCPRRAWATTSGCARRIAYWPRPTSC